LARKLKPTRLIRLGGSAGIESKICLLRFAYARAHIPRQQQQQGIGIALSFIVIV
jgi:hypothetical protein